MQHRTEIFWGLTLLSMAIVAHGCMTFWAQALPRHGHTVVYCDAPAQPADGPGERAELPAPFTVSADARLSLDRAVTTAGGPIRVSFRVTAPVADDAWIGVIPDGVPHGSEAVNDRYDLSYQYLGGQTVGIMEFRGPDQPGRYELRLHDTDADGRELAAVRFEVVGPQLLLE